jgi:GT2 family glycosyltransferase
VSVVRALGLGKVIPNALQPRWSHHWDHVHSRHIEAADGAVFLVRGETWDQLGGYNERRRMYGEDSDLCWRTRRLGWRIRFESLAEFVHLGNATGSRRWTDAQRAALIGREEAKLLREQLSPVGASISIGATTAYLTWRRALFLLRGDTPAAAAMKAERSAYFTGLRARRGAASP